MTVELFYDSVIKLNHKEIDMAKATASEDMIRPFTLTNTVPPIDMMEPSTKMPEKAGRDDDQEEGVIKGVRFAGGQMPPTQEKGYESPAKIFNNRFILGKDGKYCRLGETRVALVDEAEQIRFIDKQMDTFHAGIELVKAKGWQAIQVIGTERFRSEAWFHARMSGLEVVGYEPQEKDLKRLEAAQHRQERDDKAAPSDAVKESEQEARNYVLNNYRGIHMANVERECYVGPVVYETGHHLVQDSGRGIMVLHEKSRFTEKFPCGQRSVKIQYQGGIGAIGIERNGDHGHDR